MNIVERATELMTNNYSNMDYLIVPLNDSDAVLVTVFDENLSSESKKPKKVHSGDLIFLVNPRLQEEAENSVVLVDFSGTAIEVLSKDLLDCGMPVHYYADYSSEEWLTFMEFLQDEHFIELSKRCF